MSDTFDPKHMIDVREGLLVSKRAALCDAFADAAATNRPVVMHFHGGLISGDAALAAAAVGIPFYQQAGAYPLYPIWHTGLLEVLADDGAKIAQETLFKMLVDRVAGWTHAQIANAAGARSATPTRTLPTVTVEAMAESGDGPGDFSADFLQHIDLSNLTGSEIDLTPMERLAIESALQRDRDFKAEWDAVLRGAGKRLDEGSRDLDGASELPPKASEADPELLAKLQTDSNSRGLGITAAKLVVAIIYAVLRRFVKGADHGLHATVTEEVLRAVYLGKAGTAVWSTMKEYTLRAFGGDPERHAGTAMVQELTRLPGGQRVMLVGHSAGSIFICHLVKELAKAGRAVEVVFLAPAARCTLFRDALVSNPNVLAKPNGYPAFRMFSMSDPYETKDVLIRNVRHMGNLGWFYPRSLLYFISGLLEGNAVDADLVGLQRTHLPGAWYASEPPVRETREWIGSPLDRVAWSISPEDAPLRMRTNSIHHGGFGTPGSNNVTMESVAELLKGGW